MRTETTQLPGAEGADTPGRRFASARWVVISLLASGLALAHAGSSAGQDMFGAGGGGGGVNKSGQAGSGGAGGHFFGAGGGGGGGGGESGGAFHVFVGAEGGLNWLLNNNNLRFDTGFAAGLAVGLEDSARRFRLELEAVLRSNVGHGSFTANGVPSSSSTVCGEPFDEFLPPACTTTTTPGSPGSVGSTSGVVPQLAFMLNGFYDFLPGATFTPFVGAGLGLALVDGASQFSSAQFAYQAIVGVAWNITPQVRLSLDTRYFGTTNPGAYTDSNITTMLSISYRFAPSAPAVAPPPFVPPPTPEPQAPSVVPPVPRVRG